MRMYHPQIRVLLIKAMRRQEIAPGVPVIQERYRQLDSIDLTPYLGDLSSVQATKSTRQPCGAFSIRLLIKSMLNSFLHLLRLYRHPENWVFQILLPLPQR
jgi:hypothetical protein